MNNLTSIIESLSNNQKETIIKPFSFDIPITNCVYYIKLLFDKGLKEDEILKRYNNLSIANKLYYCYLSHAGDNYILTDNNIKLLQHLCLYFTGFPSDKYSLNKGIYLYGWYGTGKTTIFDNFREVLIQCKSKNVFIVTSIEQVIEHYREHQNLKKFYYNYQENDKYTPFHLIINDYGCEINQKIYGTDVFEIINELIMLRYECFKNRENPKLTHITSNISFNDKDKFWERTPHRIKDRLLEMFNVIKINGKSFRQNYTK
jgi:DNA replication protein DnaC